MNAARSWWRWRWRWRWRIGAVPLVFQLDLHFCSRQIGVPPPPPRNLMHLAVMFDSINTERARDWAQKFSARKSINSNGKCRNLHNTHALCESPRRRHGRQSSDRSSAAAAALLCPSAHGWHFACVWRPHCIKLHKCTHYFRPRLSIRFARCTGRTGAQPHFLPCARACAWHIVFVWSPVARRAPGPDVPLRPFSLDKSLQVF